MKINRAWVVMAGCMLMYGAMMGLCYNCAGVLITGVIQAEGFSSSDVAGFYTLRSLVTAAAMLFTAGLLNRYPMKLIITLSGVLAGLGFALMYVYTQPWMWSVSGVLIGLGTSLSMLLTTLVMRNWFTKKRGTMVGFVTMFSGILGTVLNPPLGELISRAGWRTAALVLGLATFGGIALGAVLMVKHPADVGAEPYGGTDPALASVEKKKTGRRVPVQPGRYLFVFFGVTTGMLCAQIISYVPQFTASLGYPLVIGAALTSAVMVGNTSSKLLFGLATDYLGIWRSVQLFFGMIVGSLVIFAFFHEALPLLYLASVLLGFAYTGTLGISLVCVELFPPEDFEVHYGRCYLLSNLIGGLVPGAASLVYDRVGSFQSVFVAFAVLLSGSMVLLALRGKLGIVTEKK